MTDGGDPGAHGLPTLEFDIDGERVLVRAADVVVGRTSRCTLRVVHPLVSREHCRVEARADGLHVLDLASVNGTWVNGDRIDARTQVRCGDRVGLGQGGAVLVVVRAMVGGADVSRPLREEDRATLVAGDPLAAGAVARIEVAPAAVRAPDRPSARGEPPAREAATGTVPVAPALRTEELRPAARTARPYGFVPGLAAGVVIGLAAIGALLRFTHALDPLRPAAHDVRDR